MIETRTGKKIPTEVGETDNHGYTLLAGTSRRGISLLKTPKGRFSVYQNAWGEEGEMCILIFGPNISAELAREWFERLR